MKNEIKTRNIIFYFLLFILTISWNYHVYYKDIKKEALADRINSGNKSKMASLDENVLMSNRLLTAGINFTIDSSGFQTKRSLDIPEGRDSAFKIVNIHN
ncbi:MAG: hypothetical protein U0W24_16405 [Bacteroidales bacterium]